jgi:hypothetical protein
MDPTIVVPHFTSFTLFAVYTYVFSTGISGISFMLLLDYGLVSAQTASLLLFLIIYHMKLVILIKSLFILLTFNFLVMSMMGFTTPLHLSIDEIKLFITRLIVTVLELLLIMKFGMGLKPHPPASPPMSKPPSYSTFEPINGSV